MVMVATAILPIVDGNINLSQWLHDIEAEFTPAEVEQIRLTCCFIQNNYDTIKTPLQLSCIAIGLEIATILLALKTDAQIIVASILYPALQYSDLEIEDLKEQYPVSTCKLLQSALQMDFIGDLQGKATPTNRLDNYRRMLLSMVDDVRIVLLKLSERTVFMRHVQQLEASEQHKISQQTLDIFAPLANRLGILALKWELEDLAFHILQSEDYFRIAEQLQERRIEREHYIESFIENLRSLMQREHINGVEISGRVKHIYSIYKKMSRKDIAFDKIYDAYAIRVIVKSISDCYAVLSIINSHWQQIASEFVDYISTPKENGYQSIHAILTTPENKNIEVQIRTYDMHEKNEVGGAAHWIYKEGSQEVSYQRKIAWLRQLLDWQQEMVSTAEIPAQIIQGLIEDRIYVFSPESEVVSLMRNSTPLDYAYAIHSEIGHKCRGAKVNDRMVPLTYQLQTGDRVAILTAKEASPSRDWLNPQLGYLTNARAKGKIHAWFKKRDFDANAQEGQLIFNREIKRFNLNVNPDTLAVKFHLQTGTEFLAGLGSGDIRIPQFTGLLQDLVHEKSVTNHTFNETPKIKKTTKTPKTILVEGVDNLLTQIAHCCKPLPGEEIMGYITINRGVSVHRKECSNLANMSLQQSERLIRADWGDITSGRYDIDLTIEASSHHDLLRDITKILSDAQINIVGLNSYVDHHRDITVINLSIVVNSLKEYNQLQHRLQCLPQIVGIKRQ
jgi:GTP pyrophosphokinase